MKLAVAVIAGVSSALISLQAQAVTPQVQCQAKLLKITSEALDAELPKKSWDVGRITGITYNYNLPDRDRTVFMCTRNTDPDKVCLMQVYTTHDKVDSTGCPEYKVSEVTSTCL